MQNSAGTMRAAVWTSANEPLRLETVPIPVPGREEIRVRVAACGVCHSDLHVMRGEVAFPGPGVLGHEISGTVDALGPETGGFAIGDRVVSSFILPCGRCRQCDAERDDLCETFFLENRLRGNLLDGTSRLTRSDGSRLSMYSMAGLAEYAIVPIRAVAPLGEELPLHESSVLGCAGLTAWGAIRAAERVGPGVAVAVVAVGGVGSSLIQLAKHLGASPIIAIDIDDAKLAAATEWGADFALNSRADGIHQKVLDATEGRGVRVAFEALGRPESFELAVSLLGASGRMVAIGIADRDAGASIPITGLVRRGLSIVGSFGGSAERELPGVIDAAAHGGFDVRRAVTARYSLEDAAQAYEDLAARKIIGRGIIVMDETALSDSPAGI